MIWWLIFAVFLYFICAVLIVAEIFVPSGGLISILAIACLAGGIAVFFHYSVIAGWIGVGVAPGMIAVVLVIAYKMFPKTKFGKSVTLNPPNREQGDAVPDTDQLKELLGAVGVGRWECAISQGGELNVWLRADMLTRGRRSKLSTSRAHS